MTLADASPKLKASDPKVRYMGPEDGPFQCDNCRFYLGDKQPCEKVSDPIRAKGCCNLFKPD